MLGYGFQVYCLRLVFQEHNNAADFLSKTSTVVYSAFDRDLWALLSSRIVDLDNMLEKM